MQCNTRFTLGKDIIVLSSKDHAWLSLVVRALLLRNTINIYALLTKREIKMTGYWPISFLRFDEPR